MDDAALANHYERIFGPFTHMGPGDKAIWTTYLMHGGAQFAPFEYDLRVGDGTQLPDGSNQLSRSIALALTRKRIDVLYFFQNRPVIVEVKQRAGLSAVGQLLGYRKLYMTDHPDHGEPMLLLVTDVLQPDMIPILIENNIQYFEVRPWTNQATI